MRQLRQAEVEDLDATVPRHEEVLRLQVAVDDPFRVRRREASGDLSRVIERLTHRETSGCQALAKRFASQQLRYDVGRALFGTEVVDREDPRMVERRGGSRLLLESPQPVRVL
jgi:hypothetical protein